MGISRLQNEHYWIKKRIVDTVVVMTTRVRVKMLLYVWPYEFYYMTLSAE